MEIYQLLMQDHRVVQGILKQIEQSTEKGMRKRRDLLLKLKEALLPHSRAEEMAFYERLKKSKVKEAEDLAFEAYEEHGVAELLILELENTEPSDRRWTALASVLKENLEHHIHEEEGDLFSKAKKTFRAAEAEAIGEEFLKLKKEVHQELTDQEVLGGFATAEEAPLESTETMSQEIPEATLQ